MLSQPQNDFSHWNMTIDVMNCFNRADNFMCFITEVHLIYLAVKLSGMVEVDSKPLGLHVDALVDNDDHCQYLLDISSCVV